MLSVNKIYRKIAYFTIEIGMKIPKRFVNANIKSSRQFN